MVPLNRFANSNKTPELCSLLDVYDFAVDMTAMLGHNPAAVKHAGRTSAGASSNRAGAGPETAAGKHGRKSARLSLPRASNLEIDPSNDPCSLDDESYSAFRLAVFYLSQ